MAQVTQVTQVTDTRRGNTNSRRDRGRNWVFTLNNYTEDDIKQIKTFKGQYVFQEEKSDTNGTPHLQGTLISKNAITFNTIKKLIPRAHIEKCIDIDASIRYCTKEETRSGQIHSNLNNKKYLSQMPSKQKLPWEMTQEEIDIEVAKDTIECHKIHKRICKLEDCYCKRLEL